MLAGWSHWRLGFVFIMVDYRGCLQSLQRVLDDMNSGSFLTDNRLEYILTHIELTYRELVALQLFHGQDVDVLSSVVGVIRHCLQLTRELQLMCSSGNQCSNAVVSNDGSVGRPRYVVEQESLEMLLENRFTVPQIANILGVSISTVRRRMSEFSLYVRDLYSDITDNELDVMVSGIQRQYPMWGNRQMHGYLVSQGCRIQQARLRDCQRRIDPFGSAMRRLRTLRRRKYFVPSPLSLYHIDGHHKLIR